MTRLDHNRAVAQLAAKAGVHSTDVTADDDLGQPLGHAVPGRVPRRGRAASPASRPIGKDQAWLEDEFIPTVQQRGAAIIKARGLSSAASAANAAVDHVRSWVLGTPDGDWVSMGVVSDGSYGAPEGIISGSRARPRTASTRSCRASTSTTSAAPASTRATPSSSTSATPSSELGLI